MRADPRTGFLAAADISGYTAFLTGSELDHAHDVMRGVMRVLTSALTHPLRIVKYEGDAILCYAPDDSPLLLDVLEGAYLAFTDHVFNMTTCTTCTCRACGNIKHLDLKFFLHHGSYIIEQDGAGQDLAGPDVILLHRLMKNRVKETTGVQAYILATAAALKQSGSPAGFAEHVEHYEHFGEVSCGVSDLRATLAQRRDAREVRVTRGDAQVVVEGVVPGPPSAVWDFFFDPAKRLAWDVSLTAMRSGLGGQRREGVGARMHCAHGSFSSVGTTLDWKPFRYFTQEHVPERDTLLNRLAPSVLVTIETEATGDGATRVAHLARASRSGAVPRLLMKLGSGSFEKEVGRSFERLAKMLQAGSAPDSRREG